MLVVALAVAGSAAADLHNQTITAGSTYSITGQTGPGGGHRRATGTVILSGKLNSGPWLVLVRTRTKPDGTYKVTITPMRRGRLLLRLSTPDHLVRHVTLTIV